jgi:hypothetical protein
VVPVTCSYIGDPNVNAPGTVVYGCSPPAQDVQEAQTAQGVGMGEGDGVVVNPKTGFWRDEN